MSEYAITSQKGVSNNGGFKVTKWFETANQKILFLNSLYETRSQKSDFLAAEKTCLLDDAKIIRPALQGASVLTLCFRRKRTGASVER